MGDSSFLAKVLLAAVAVMPLQAGPLLFSDFTGSGTYPGGRGVCDLVRRFKS